MGAHCASTIFMGISMDRANLWELGTEQARLHREIAAAAEHLGESDPEAQAGAVALLEELLRLEEGNQEALAAKADGYCWVVAELRAQAEAREQEATRLLGLANGDRAKADRLEAALLRVLQSLDPEATRFELPYHRITSRRSTAVVVDADADVPADYLTVRRTEAPNRRLLKEALEAGVVVPGVRLEERRSWRIG